MGLLPPSPLGVSSLAIAAFPCASVTIVLFSTTTITGRTRSRETDAEKEKKSTRERERELVPSVVANSSRQVVTETVVHVGEENEACNHWQLQLLLLTRRRRSSRGQGVTVGYGNSWGCGLLEVVRKRQKRDRV